MYAVKAVKWNDETKQQEWYLAGIFPDYITASIFKNSYKNHFSCRYVEIVDFGIPFVPYI